jgi:hypothetical protein
VSNRRVVEPLRGNRRTLAEHYAERLAHRAMNRRSAADELLLQVFTKRPRRRTNAVATTFLRAHRARLVTDIALATGVTRYSVRQVMRIAIMRAAALDLRLRASQRAALPHVRWLLKRMLRDMGQGATPALPL